MSLQIRSDVRSDRVKAESVTLVSVVEVLAVDIPILQIPYFARLRKKAQVPLLGRFCLLVIDLLQLVQ